MTFFKEMKIQLFVTALILVSSLLGMTEEITKVISAPNGETDLEVLIIDRQEKRGSLDEGEVGVRFRFDAKNRTETLKLGFVCDPNSQVGDVHDCWSEDNKIASFIYPCRSADEKEYKARLFVIQINESGIPTLISLPSLDRSLKDLTKAKAPFNIASSSINHFHHFPFGWVSDSLFTVSFNGSCMLQNDIEDPNWTEGEREMSGCVIYRLAQDGQFVVHRIINLSIQG